MKAKKLIKKKDKIETKLRKSPAWKAGYEVGFGEGFNEGLATARSLVKKSK